MLGHVRPGFQSGDRLVDKPDSILNGRHRITHHPSTPGLIRQPGVQNESIYTNGKKQSTSSSSSSDSSSSSNVYDSLRDAFKLPAGLCLVRCDSLRPDQSPLSPDQVRDVLIASGRPGLTGNFWSIIIKFF